MHPYRPSFVPALVLALVLHACSDPGAPETTTPESTTVRVALAATAAPPQLPWVPKSELDCLLADFTTHIQLGPVGSEHAMGTRTLKVPVGGLRKAVGALTGCTGDSLRAVQVHVGLDASDRFDVALECVCLVPVAGSAPQLYTHDSASVHYLLVADTLAERTGTVWTWWNDAGRRYRENVVVKRSPGSGFAPFLPGHDVTSLIFPFDRQLEQLIGDNGLTDTDHLRLVATAGPRIRTVNADSTVFEGDFAQGVVWLPGDKALDDVSHTHAYEAKGADLGSPCPFHCAYVLIRTTGLERRPGC